MSLTPHAGLGADWLSVAGAELAHLGFVLRDGQLPGSVPGPRLLVAFRRTPTLEHFDPEEATFWSFGGDHGALESLTGESALRGGLPLARPFSWGRIRILDRVPVFNQFLSFGGSLRADRLADGTVIAAFVSRAPILRWSGHSQETDRFADEVGSFFARLMVPVDFQDGAEERIGGASPEGLYSAAVRYADRRLNATAALREADPGLDAAVNRAVHRLINDEPRAWAEGQALLDWLELG